MNNVTRFCMNKHIPKHIQDAFFAYCRSTYSAKYNLANGETMKFAVGKLNDAELEDAWQDFIKVMRTYLTPK